MISTHRIPPQHSDSSTSISNASPIAREHTYNPLWIVTVAGALLFALLTVLLASG